MKVFAVERCYEYEGCVFVGVFSTQEKADTFCAGAHRPGSMLEIHEVDVDDLCTTSPSTKGEP